jgi:SufS family cysteine desulfurase
MFDPVRFKQDFPLFSQEENKLLVYLDNAATTQKPQCVIDAIVNFYLHENGNANRASHRLARSATAMTEKVRQQAASFLGAKTKDEIIFTSGATEGINLLASGLAHLLNEDDEILLSIAEHHANLVPWQEVAKSKNIKLVFCEQSTNKIKEKITSKTKIISCLIASNVLGEKNSLELFQEIKKKYPEIIIILDASQVIGHENIDVSNNFCDFLVGSAHKFYGPTGIGLLYKNSRKSVSLQPIKFGGEMIKKVSKYSSVYTDAPYIYEAGTSSLAAIAGLGACIEYLIKKDLDEISKYEQKLVGYLHKKLSRLIGIYSGLTLLTAANNNIGIAAIASKQYSMTDIGFWLDEADIAVRVGDHCAQPLLDAMKLDSVLRISIAAYNTFDDIDTVCKSLKDFLDLDINTLKNITNSIEKDISFNDEYSSIKYHDFINISSWQVRYKKILILGKKIKTKECLREDKNLLAGCESKLWLAVSKDMSLSGGEVYYFDMDSNSDIVKGLASLILSRVNGKTREQIKNIDFESFFEGLDLKKYLSESRFSGMKAITGFIFITVN